MHVAPVAFSTRKSPRRPLNVPLTSETELTSPPPEGLNPARRRSLLVTPRLFSVVLPPRFASHGQKRLPAIKC